MRISKKNTVIKISLLVLLILIILFLWSVAEITIPFIIALLLAYLIAPLVKKMQKHKFSVGAATGIIYLISAAVVIAILALALPSLLQQLESLPQMIHDVKVWWQQMDFGQWGLKPPSGLRDAVGSMLDKMGASVTDFGEKALQATMGSLKYLFYLGLGMVLSFYILRDQEVLKKRLMALLPPAHRPEILRMCDDINYLLRQFIRGHVLVSIIVGFLTFIALTILGVKYALILGLFMTVADLIPYFGPLIGILPAVVIAFFQSEILALLTLLALGFIQQLESMFITPKIVGDRVGMHPLTIIFVVLAGGYLFGILGMLFAVPVAAAAVLVIKYIYSKIVAWKETDVVQK